MDALLVEGERLVGEWLAPAHGTRYDAADLASSPFVIFDLIAVDTRITREALDERLAGAGPALASVIATGPLPVSEAMRLVATSRHGATDPVECVVYRCERNGSVDFFAKYVRPDKVDGCYLPEVSGRDAVWNRRP